MLKLMRTHAGSWVIKIILGAIVVVFVFWGVGSFQSSRASKAAMVNGETITQDEYRETYDNLLSQYRQRFGGNLNDDMLKMLNLKKQTLDQLVDRVLIRQEAAKLDFKVSVQELTDFIHKTEVFQENGTFDERRYHSVLANNHLTVEKFEAMQKEAILGDKLRTLILGSVKISDEEASEWYKWNDASVKIAYMLFKPEKYQDITLGEEELKTYFDGHKDKYKTEPKVRLQFVHFKPDNYASKVTVTDEEIREYYEGNIKEFENPKKVSARHILIKADKGSKSEIIDEKKKKALEIYEQAKSGTDFAELAKTYSEDPGSKDKGGELGEFTQERMVKPFADKAFSMSAGEIGDPILTDFGWHIIKVEKVTDAITFSLDESKDKIRKKLTDERTKSIAYDEAYAFYEKLPKSGDMTRAAQSEKLDIFKTELLERKDIIVKKDNYNGIADRSKLAQVAFTLPVMELSEIEDFGDGYYILEVTEKFPKLLPSSKMWQNGSKPI
ncbi:MAG: peptidyl-prolyl cis-trans isomerase [Desulfobacteraceae bacterium]|nr:peptidyl-prolyl cis-trans isomerase [Desulfobacteraceae bacterium]